MKCPACQSEAAHYLRHSGRDYHRCLECGTIFVPGAEPEPDVYNDVYFDKFRMFSGSRESKRLNSARIEFLLRSLHMNEKRPAFLDFGCGSGDFLNDLRCTVSRPCHMVGVDVNPAAVRFIRARFLHVEVFRDLDPVRMCREPFDAVTAFDVIEHFADPNGVMDALSSLIKPCGIFMVSMPFLPDNGFTPEIFSEWRHFRPREHFCHFTLGGLKRFLARHRLAAFANGHPEDVVRRVGVYDSLGPHNILTVVAIKEPEHADPETQT